MQIEKLEKYCKTMLLDFVIDESLLILGEEVYSIIEDDSKILFDEEMDFFQQEDWEDDIDGWVYEFGGRWYTQSKDSLEVEFKELKYVGKAIDKLGTKSFLGVRSGYELMNGMGLYGDWVKKAKFLGVESLGICERSTLSGALLFQNECLKNGIKPIIGMTIPTKHKTQFDIKCYVMNFQGWLNLLKFNEKLNVDGSQYIDFEFLKDNRIGLYVVADPKSMPFEEANELSIHIDFYQLDTVRFLNEERDKGYLDNLEKYLLGEIDPISIVDAFYLEKNDWRTREMLWTINKAFDDKTDNQYFKSNTEYAMELVTMFEKGSKSWIKLYKKAIEGESRLIESCNFTYDTNTRHLPRYKMTKEEEEEFSSNNDFFIHLIKKGLKDRKIKDTQKYIDRLKIEIDVLKAGDVIDYFLSLYDIIKYAKSKGMLTGIGRGSAGGSLVAYLLGIIQIDPLEFDLLFERFLNSGRMGKWEDRPSYTFESEDGTSIELGEGSLATIVRDGEEKVVYCHQIKEGDEIIKY